MLRSPWTALAGLVAFVFGWHVWALLVDQRLTGCSVDIPLRHTFLAMDQFREGLFLDMLDGGLDPKGPVAPILGALMTWVTGDVVLGCRMVSVLAHCAMMVQVYDLGRFLPQRPHGRLWAAMYVGITPLIIGWARLEFHEPVLGVIVLGVLQLMLRSRLDRLLPAAALGPLMALGVLTKLSFLVFMVLPGPWLVARRLRTWRSVACLTLMLWLLGAMVEPWLWSHRAVIVDNFHGSSHGPEIWEMVLHRFVGPAHISWLWVLSTATALLLWWQKGTDRWVVALLLLFPLVSLAQFMFRFEYWTRYMVPVYPVMALLAGAGVSWILERLPRPAARPAAAALSLTLLGSFIYWQLTLSPWPGREYEHGMQAPDPGPYNGYTLATRPFLGARLPMMEAILPGFAHTRWKDMSRIWRWRGKAPQRVDRQRLADGRYAGRTVGVLLVGDGGPKMSPGVFEGWCPDWLSHLKEIRPPEYAALRKGEVRCLVTVVEPDHLTFVAYSFSSKR